MEESAAAAATAAVDFFPRSTSKSRATTNNSAKTATEIRAHLHTHQWFGLLESVYFLPSFLSFPFNTTVGPQWKTVNQGCCRCQHQRTHCVTALRCCLPLVILVNTSHQYYWTYWSLVISVTGAHTVLHSFQLLCVCYHHHCRSPLTQHHNQTIITTQQSR